ncbi:MAG TPA: hypothetical protein PLU72_18820, partial [Candidatus Ozemobacteraceae bacterium]|nr:hypothetical protein [Candidatus Ozemobacteraceae bacterium]
RDDGSLILPYPRRIAKSRFVSPEFIHDLLHWRVRVGPEESDGDPEVFSLRGYSAGFDAHVVDGRPAMKRPCTVNDADKNHNEKRQDNGYFHKCLA